MLKNKMKNYHWKIKEFNYPKPEGVDDEFWKEPPAVDIRIYYKQKMLGDLITTINVDDWKISDLIYCSVEYEECVTGEFFWFTFHDKKICRINVDELIGGKSMDMPLDVFYHILLDLASCTLEVRKEKGGMEDSWYTEMEKAIAKLKKHINKNHPIEF